MTTYRVDRARNKNDLAKKASQLIASQIALALDQRVRAKV